MKFVHVDRSNILSVFPVYYQQAEASINRVWLPPGGFLSSWKGCKNSGRTEALILKGNGPAAWQNTKCLGCLNVKSPSVAPSRSRDTCVCTVCVPSSLLPLLPPNTHTLTLLNIQKPSSWHPTAVLGRSEGTWELNLYHPSYQLSNISGVQYFTREWWKESTTAKQKAPSGNTPLKCSAHCHYSCEVFRRNYWRYKRSQEKPIHVEVW